MSRVAAFHCEVLKELREPLGPECLDRNYGVRDQRSIVSFDQPFDNLGFLSEKFRQILLYVVRS